MLDDVVKILKIDQTSTDDQTNQRRVFLADKFFYIFNLSISLSEYVNKRILICVL